jgi:hypothetical protein
VARFDAAESRSVSAVRRRSGGTPDVSFVGVDGSIESKVPENRRRRQHGHG